MTCAAIIVVLAGLMVGMNGGAQKGEEKASGTKVLI